jgi:hypothetical protein
MSEIMSQPGSLCNVGIKATESFRFPWLFANEFFRHAARQLAHLDRVSEAVVIHMSALGRDYLRNLSQACKRCRI